MEKETEIFDESNRLARDLAEGWFKFESVGDKIGGTVRDMFELPSRDGMPAQRCFTIETKEGNVLNVGLKRTNYILTRTDMLQLGDQLGVKFEKEIPPKIKSFHPAKSMVIFTKLIGPRAGLTAKDIEVPKEETQQEEAIEVGEF